MEITLEQYFMGREKTYAAELSAEIRENAAATVARVNKLLRAMASVHAATFETRPGTDSIVSSGWRPAAVNARTPGAALRSKHMLGQACDLFDPDGDIDNWCFANLDTLAEIGLWMEHPAATKGWCHVQIVPPRSGKRVFYP